MGFSAVAAAMVASSAYSADKNRSAMHQAADSARASADAKLAQDKQIADAQTKQANDSLAQQQAIEAQREATMQANAANAESEQRRQLADANAAGFAQNTPTVQLATAAPGGTITDQRQRRAAFRPEYSTGVTI